MDRDVEPSGWDNVMLSPSTAVAWPTTDGSTTAIAVTVQAPASSTVCRERILSPTWRSDSAISSPSLVIVVSSVTVIVRVQPSTVSSEIDEPLIAVIVMLPAANPP